MSDDFETIAELDAALAELIPLMEAKGVVTPSAKAERVTIGRHNATLGSHRAQGHVFGEYGNVFFHADTLKGAIAKAREHIAALPTPETTALHKYMRNLGKVVDQGRKDGIPDEYTQPVSLTIKAMSDNLLAAPEGTS